MRFALPSLSNRSHRYLLVTLAPLVLGCGGGGSSGGGGHVSRISGLVQTDSIHIDGKLLMDPGAGIALLSNGSLSIAGVIAPNAISASATLLDRVWAGLRGEAVADSPPSPLVLGGNAINNLNSAAHEAGGSVISQPGQDIDITTIGNNGTISLGFGIQGGDGADAPGAGAPGQSGGSIHIGDATAIGAVNDAAQKAGQQGKATKPANAIVGVNLKAGNGGHGFDDVNGPATGVTNACASLRRGKYVYEGTDGGGGGEIVILGDALQGGAGVTWTGGDG